MQRRSASPYLLHIVLITGTVISHKCTAVSEHRLGGLSGVVEGVISLSQVVLDDADLCAQGRQSLAILCIVHSERPGKALCCLNRFRIGCVHGRQPLAKQGYRLSRLKSLLICKELLTQQFFRCPACRGVQQDKDIVPAAILRNVGKIPNQGRHLVFRQPPEDRPEHRPLAETAADITGIEENLHGQIRILGKGAQETVFDLFLVLHPKRTDRCKQVQAVGACSAKCHCAVFSIGSVRYSLQKIQHDILSFP